MNFKIIKKKKYKQNWFIINAKNKILGRISSKISYYLINNYRISNNYYFIIINAKKIKVSGKKKKNKIYYSHSGYPGGIHKINFIELYKKSPCKILYKSIKGMLPKNKLRKLIIKKLKIYSNSNHPHQAQKPKLLNIY